MWWADVILKGVWGVLTGYCLGMTIFLRMKTKLLDVENTILKHRIVLLEKRLDIHQEYLAKVDMPNE